MTEIRVEHGLATDEVLARLQRAAAEHDVGIETTGERSGTLSKATAFGPVVASFQIEEGAVAVTVDNRPAFLPEGMVARLVEENLRGMLSGGDA